MIRLRAGKETNFDVLKSNELAFRRCSQDREFNRASGQLDLKGAFDRVHHGWLIATLKDQGWPRWVVRWVTSFLADRTATLTFDDWEAEPLKVPAGVPQGSPLSPLLFILFSTPLFQRQGISKE
ncbi:uncharacterized protein J7T54_000291 [Emericellopsis cladophorae]|uniref:Reverse transcriptase domain-containing protein n=1 Tax=Emericellopsis cladophorae TaxID=2686198 RepID=A0A9Q0B7M9_9HYPO|nr:uncharacterized protein J7T54_000291 [Emericellopsis cladophorae]KAI6777602.1 hypothetical protein J7T54_000291 [Emericellopsis cladophorae]